MNIKTQMKSMVLLIFALFLNSESIACSWPPQPGDNEPYNTYLTRISTETGTVSLASGPTPIKVEFEVQPNDDSSPDTTQIQAKRFYLDNGKRMEEGKALLLSFPHVRSEVAVIPVGQLYIDVDGTIYLPNTVITDYERPSMPIVNLSSHFYSRAESDHGDWKEVSAFRAELENAVVASPPSGFYLRRGTEETELVPYIYSLDSNLYLGRLTKARYDLTNVQPGYRFSLVFPTHRLKVRQECMVKHANVNEPFSRIERGLYSKKGDEWYKVNHDFEPDTSDTFQITRDSGPMVDIKINPECGSKRQILNDLLGISNHFAIGSLNFSGFNFGGNEFNTFRDLLRNCTYLETLNLRTEKGEVNYNELVEAMTALNHLKELDVTNCGFSGDNKGRLQRKGLSITDDTPRPPSPIPAPVVVAPAPAIAPKPAPSVVQMTTEDAMMKPQRRSAYDYANKREYDVTFYREITVWSDGTKKVGAWKQREILVSHSPHKLGAASVNRLMKENPKPISWPSYR